VTTPHSLKYRPDVDGLRALAILPVILYHAKLACPGGFVGVDIFFVISGFLITSLILQKMADGSFSLIHFWERRIRRILPALSVVMLATLIAAYYWFLPLDFASVGKSVAAQAVMGGNFYFWKQLSGYFALGTETKPLLHTWSLAVEEQCYLLFPLMMLMFARFRKNPFFVVILSLSVASLAFSIFGSYTAHNQKTAFYLLPARAWELMLGALLAASKGKIHAGVAVREGSGWLGVALICWPVFFYDITTRFPGLGALPPCLGAALIIFASESKPSSVGRLLSFRPVVFVGLISYSLYLWHWPLLAFGPYLSKFEPTISFKLWLLAASFLLAILSWQFIEKPFRQRRIFRQRPQIFAFAGTTLITLLALGLVVAGQQGFPSRFPAAAVTYAEARTHTCYQSDAPWSQHMVKFSLTETNPPVDVVIWGDSHALALSPMLDQLCQKRSWSVMDATLPGTAPVLGKFSHLFCPDEPSVFAPAVLKFISTTRPHLVIMGARWSGYTPTAEFKSNVVATVRAVKDLGIPVYVVKDVPIPGYDVPRFASLAMRHPGNTDQLVITQKRHRYENRELETEFDQIARLGATVLDPAPYFLDGKGFYRVDKNGQVLYCDKDHLSVEGAMMLAPLFESVFRDN